MKKMIRGAEESNGVFWVVDDELFAYPFYEDASTGLAKSGSTYNHKNLWKEIAPKHCQGKPFDYYPRGRVEFKSNGQPVIYMNPNISDSIVAEIKQQFGLRTQPKIQLDYSDHYKCHLDEGYSSSKYRSK